MFDKTQPLWMPPGSVRAILALGLVIVTCVLAFNGKITAEAFLPVVIAVIAFYFGAKAGSSMPEQAGDAVEERAAVRAEENQKDAT